MQEKLQEQKKFSVRKISTMGLLIALSISLLLIVPGGGWPIFPIVPWLKYDLVDIPVIICSYLYGIKSGVIVLFLVAGIQSVAFGTDGLVGFLMHFIASSTLVVANVYSFKYLRGLLAKIVAIFSSSISMTALMLIINLYFVPLVFPITFEQALFFLPWTAAFNAIKAGLNTLFSIIIWEIISPIFTAKKKKCSDDNLPKG